MRGEADVSDDLNAEIARLTAEVERLNAPTGRFLDGVRWRDERMLAAEATATRYAEALRYIDSMGEWHGAAAYARAALASHPAPVAPETREEAGHRAVVDHTTPCTRCGAALNDGSGGYQCHYVDGKPYHATCSMAAHVERHDAEIRAQGRRDGLEEAFVVLTKRMRLGEANIILALLDAPPAVADPLDAVAEIVAWRGLSEEQRRAHLDKLDALIDFAEAGSDEPVRVVDRTVTALLRRLAPPPVASKETP